MARHWPLGLVGILCLLGVAGLAFLRATRESAPAVSRAVDVEVMAPAQTSAGPGALARTKAREPTRLDASEARPEEEAPPDPTGFEVRGHVVDSSGVGLAGMSIQLRRGRDVRVVGTPSGPGGSFVVEGTREGDHLSASGEGFVCVKGHRVVRGELATIVCDRGSSLKGVVLSASGSPVEGARIALDQVMADVLRAADGDADSALLPLDARSDSSGRFELGLPDPQVERAVRVLLNGTERLRAEIPVPHPEFLELRLPAEGASDSDPAPEASITGLVMGLDGEPRAGWVVHAFAAGEPLDLLGSRGSAPTRSDGRFEFSALVPGSYAVVAFDPVSLVRTSVESTPAPARNLLLTPNGTSARPMAGVLRAPDGSPLAGVRVAVLPEGLSASVSDVLDWVPRTVSDASGAFEFSRNFGREVSLVFSGPEVAHAVRSPSEASTDARGIPSYQLARLCRVQLTFSDRPEGEAVEFRDARDAPLVSELRTSNVQLRLARIPWTGNQVVEILVPEVAMSLVVLRGAEEVGSRSIVLDLERTTEVTID